MTLPCRNQILELFRIFLTEINLKVTESQFHRITLPFIREGQSPFQPMLGRGLRARPRAQLLTYSQQMHHFAQQGIKEKPANFLCLAYASSAMVVMCHTACSPGATGETVPSLSDGVWTQVELQRRMQLCKSQAAGHAWGLLFSLGHMVF